jgi:hypothetical protein
MRPSYQGIPNVIFLQECSRYGCTATIYFSYFLGWRIRKQHFFIRNKRQMDVKYLVSWVGINAWLE